MPNSEGEKYMYKIIWNKWNFAYQRFFSHKMYNNGIRPTMLPNIFDRNYSIHVISALHTVFAQNSYDYFIVFLVIFICIHFATCLSVSVLLLNWPFESIWCIFFVCVTVCVSYSFQRKNDTVPKWLCPIRNTSFF